jgi:hypothetical protein
MTAPDSSRPGHQSPPAPEAAAPDPGALETGVSLLRGASRSDLLDPARLADLMIDCGLAADLLDEGQWLPPQLAARAGRGLRLFQNPMQFAPYLVYLAGRGITSYLEIGVFHGGTFVFTVEYLARFNPVVRAVAVDINPSPLVAAYLDFGPGAASLEFWRTDSASPEFLARLGPAGFDLALIDGCHGYLYVRNDFLTMHLRRTGHIAFHDIANDPTPGVRACWLELATMARRAYRPREFTAQYPHLEEQGRSSMGIGVLERRG